EKLGSRFRGNDEKWRLRVVIHRYAVAQGHRLASQHIAGRHLFVGEAVTRGHLDLALRYFRPASRAYAGLAGERRGKPRGAGAIEDVAGGERHPARTSVEGDR